MAALLFIAMMLAPDLSSEASRAVAIGECKAVDPKEIVVCGSRRRNDRFRLPDRSNAPFDPMGQASSVMHERVEWAAEGDVGAGSCGAVGPAGFSGCMVKSWKRERDQTQWGKNAPKRRW